MIKSQLALAVILVSLSMPALAGWAPILGSGIGITSDNDNDAHAFSPNTQNIVFISISKPCLRVKIENYVLKVNETPVKMAFACLNKSQELVGATSEEGRSFIFNEFKTKNTVKIGNWIFSTEGFTKAKIESKNDAKNAL